MSTREAELALPTGSYQVDPVHSSVSFEVPYMGINTFSAGVKRFNASLVDGRLSGAAEIGSLELKDENFLAHLVGADFFDAEHYPEVSFEGRDARVENSEVVFDGEITIRGIAHPATLQGTLVGPITDPRGQTRYGLRLETQIDRTAYGITWNMEMPDGSKSLDDIVTLKAELSFVEEA
jgi:polyisoprenoid-binding protein YceI